MVLSPFVRHSRAAAASSAVVVNTASVLVGLRPPDNAYAKAATDGSFALH